MMENWNVLRDKALTTEAGSWYFEAKSDFK